MVAAVRRGESLRVVARHFGVGIATVAHWVERAKGHRLDRVDWSDRSHAPHQPRRTDTAVEDLVLTTRSALAHGDLGAIGAAPIRQALQEQGVAPLPALRTINRILARRGALDGRRRTRRPPPPRGWADESPGCFSGFGLVWSLRFCCAFAFRRYTLTESERSSRWPWQVTMTVRQSGT